MVRSAAMIRPESSKYGPPPADCPVAECLRLLSATWTPEILWFLHAQSRRFGDLKRDLAGISAKMLTVRLRELERRGAVQRTVKPTSPPTVEYSLTELGRRFVPVLEQIAVMGGVLTGRAVTPDHHFPPAPNPPHTVELA
jgi:DNA-binding HxlR family transcriptional regulator